LSSGRTPSLFAISKPQTETGDAAFPFEAHCAEQLAQQFNAAPRVIFVEQLTHSTNINTEAY